MVLSILHPKSGFTGHVGAVDFSNGRGSTSSIGDVVALLELRKGFKLMATAEELLEVERFRAKRRREHAEWLAEFKKLDARERSPEGVERLAELKKERDDAAAARKPRVRKYYR